MTWLYLAIEFGALYLAWRQVERGRVAVACLIVMAAFLFAIATIPSCDECGGTTTTEER